MNDDARPDQTTPTGGPDIPPHRRSDDPFGDLFSNVMRMAEKAPSDVERMLWTNYARELLAARDARQDSSARASLGIDTLRFGLAHAQAFVGECVERMRRPTLLEGVSSFVGNAFEHYTAYMGSRARERLDAAERALREAKELGYANQKAYAAAENAARKHAEFEEYVLAFRDWWRSGATFSVRMPGFEFNTRPPRPDRAPDRVRWAEGCPLFPACEDDEDPVEGESWKWLPRDLEPGYIRVARLCAGLPTRDPRHYAWQALTEDDMSLRWGDGDYLIELVSTADMTDNRVIFHRIVELRDGVPSKEFPGPDEVAEVDAEEEEEEEEEVDATPPGRVRWVGCPLFPACGDDEKPVRGQSWKYVREGLTPDHIRVSRVEGGIPVPVMRKFNWQATTADGIASYCGPGPYVVELIADAEADGQRIFRRELDVQPSTAADAPAES
jgi:hypothetical protein